MPLNPPLARPAGFGWRPDAKDRRDRVMYRAIPDITKLPERADNSADLPPAMDQGAIGSCTGYAGAALAYHTMRKDGHRRPFVPSPVFLYREARVIGGYVEEDAGAEIRNVWKAANKLGLPPMSNIKPRFKPEDMPDPNTWLFPENSIWRRQPAPSHYADGERRQVIAYYRLPLLEDMVQCLAESYCVNFGFIVFTSFYGPDGNPPIDIPDPGRFDAALGGHAVVAYGYDRARQRVMCRNSWGTTAHRGTPNFTLSFDYMRRFADDAWTARFIEGGKQP